MGAKLKIKITKARFTKGMTGVAEWDAAVGKWKVQFDDAWVGWYDRADFDVIT